MSQSCKVCSHSDRDKIDQILISGTEYRKISETFSVSISSLFRHKSSHLPDTLVKAREAREIIKADSLIAEVKSLREKTLNILQRFEDSGDLRGAIVAVRELRENVELLGKLLGEFNGDSPRGRKEVVLVGFQGDKTDEEEGSSAFLPGQIERQNGSRGTTFPPGQSITI
jgi:hypothetical protein